MDFKDWIIQYKSRKSVRGDLAYDIARDDRFPRGDDKALMLYYLKYVRHAIPEAITAFRHAFRAYKAWKKRYLDAKLLEENLRLAERIRELEERYPEERDTFEPLYRKR